MEATNDQRQRDRHDRIALVATILGVVFSLSALGLTTCQIWTIRDNAQRQMRAYVYIELAMIKYPPQNPDRIGVGFEVKNTGATWARNLVIRKAMIPKG